MCTQQEVTATRAVTKVGQTRRLQRVMYGLSAEEIAILSPSVEQLRQMILAKAVRTDGPFTLSSGGVSDWYLDLRQVTFDGAGATLVGRCVAERVHADAVAVGGLTMGADPIAVATAIAASNAGRNLRSFSIRKAPKKHGTGGKLVGPVGRGDAVVIVEDTTTTGGAIIEVIGAAQEAGLVVLDVICLVDRSDGVAKARMDEFGLPFQTLLTPKDLGF